MSFEKGYFSVGKSKIQCNPPVKMMTWLTGHFTHYHDYYNYHYQYHYRHSHTFASINWDFASQAYDFSNFIRQYHLLAALCYIICNKFWICATALSDHQLEKLISKHFSVIWPADTLICRISIDFHFYFLISFRKV